MWWWWCTFILAAVVALSLLRQENGTRLASFISFPLTPQNIVFSFTRERVDGFVCVLVSAVFVVGFFNFYLGGGRGGAFYWVGKQIAVKTD